MNPKPPFLSQENFPVLWKIFQWTIGGTIDKQKLALRKYRGQKNVLEVGCSSGNVARIFRRFKNIHFTGLDIDPNAIQLAQQDFARDKNFKFLCIDIADYAESSADRFDYILVGGVAHHVNDASLITMLASAKKLLSPDGILVVVDPVKPGPKDNWFIHLYQKMERGQFVRPYDNLKEIILKTPGLQLKESEQCVIGATPLSTPASCRFGIFSLSLEGMK